MSLKNASVILTYKLVGSLASPGRYDWKERTSSGGIIPEDQRLFIIKEAEECDCFQRTTLSEAFVNWAISDEARPERKNLGYKNLKAFTFWRKMNDTQRLAYHVAKFASDLGAHDYEYTVNEM